MKCRWCDFQPQTHCKDSTPRRDLDGQMQSHVSRAHPQEAKAYWRALKTHARAFHEKLREAYRRTK